MKITKKELVQLNTKLKRQLRILAFKPTSMEAALIKHSIQLQDDIEKALWFSTIEHKPQTKAK